MLLCYVTIAFKRDHVLRYVVARLLSSDLMSMQPVPWLKVYTTTRSATVLFCKSFLGAFSRSKHVMAYGTSRAQEYFVTNLQIAKLALMKLPYRLGQYPGSCWNRLGSCAWRVDQVARTRKKISLKGCTCPFNGRSLGRCVVTWSRGKLRYKRHDPAPGSSTCTNLHAVLLL